jgi:hypothetical protein
MIPRSTLHALAPLGVGTGASESLLSYFCRLAVSHAVSTADLARFVVSQVRHDIRDDFEWQQRNLSGIGDAARNWAAWLSDLTGVGRLDLLTLSNWSAVLPQRGLAARGAHWCHHCLREDRMAGRAPYFRLSWEVGPVEACHRHKVALVDTCPHCGKRHVRHDAGIVVPGWCTRCGGFLGDAEAPAASREQLWVAHQVEDWIGKQAACDTSPDAGTLLETLNTLILGLTGGQYAPFAKHLGVAKSTVHGWLRQGGLPSLTAYLAMAAHAELSLDQVIRGDLNGWKPNPPYSQLAMNFALAVRDRGLAPRQLDWAVIRAELESMLRLPVPISVAEAGRRLGVDDRHLYLRANGLARALGERWKGYLARRKAINRERAKVQLRETWPTIVGAGRPFNLSSVRKCVPEAVASVEGIFELISEVQEEFERT